MKIGSETGSVMNHLMSRGVRGQPIPFVGMPATMLHWTDRSAATIVNVVEIGGSKRWKFEVIVQRDHAKVVAGSGHDGSAEYEYSRDPDGTRETFRMALDGMWCKVVPNEKGRLVKSKGGAGLRIGEREEYRDPSF